MAPFLTTKLNRIRSLAVRAVTNSWRLQCKAGPKQHDLFIRSLRREHEDVTRPYHAHVGFIGDTVVCKKLSPVAATEGVRVFFLEAG